MTVERIKQMMQERVIVLDALIASEGNELIRYGLISGKTELVLLLNQIYLEEWINAKP